MPGVGFRLGPALELAGFGVLGTLALVLATVPVFVAGVAVLGAGSAGPALAREGPTLLISPPLVSTLTTTSPLGFVLDGFAAILNALFRTMTYSSPFHPTKSRLGTTLATYFALSRVLSGWGGWCGGGGR